MIVLWFSGTVKLDCPLLPHPISDNMEENLSSLELMAVIESTCNKWYGKLSSALGNLLSNEPKGKGPLAEIEFWRERHANLSALDETLKCPRVQEIIKVNRVTIYLKYKKTELDCIS